MAVYVIGDVQGCNAELGLLLAKLGFNRGTDTAVLLGDLVNRGPDSLGVLRRVRDLGSAALLVLGNHDLHALAVHVGARRASVTDTLADLLATPDAAQLFDWLAVQPLALQINGALCVHAGVLPQWSATDCIARNAQFTATLRLNHQKNSFPAWLASLFGNQPDSWRPGLSELDELRLSVNAFTRLRFCTPAGAMEFASKGDLASAPAGYVPWFDCPKRQTADTPVCFGHWSLLGLHQAPNLLGLDTGCAWGGSLSAATLHGCGKVGEIVEQVALASPSKLPGAAAH